MSAANNRAFGPSLTTYVKRAFDWKEGSYTVEFKLDSPAQYNLVGGSYAFTLNSNDIARLEENMGVIELDYRNQVVTRKEGDPGVVWNWRYPVLRETRT